MMEVLSAFLSRRDDLGEEERNQLEQAVSRVREFAVDQDIVVEGSRPTESCLVLEGFTARYKLLGDGKRQLTAFHIPGDFVDLHSFLLKTMEHGVVALTPTRIAVVPHATLERLTRQFPHLTRLLWLSTLIDGSIHREWLVSIGRRSGAARIAHVFCELFLRLQVVGRTKPNSFRLPITQAELGDALGMSVVSVNRGLQELRDANLATWRGSVVTIADLQRLEEFADFDPRYLNLEREPR